MEATLIEQTVTIKKVIAKEESKFGKAAIVVPVNGKDEFLTLNDSVSSDVFTAGKTYRIGVNVSQKGKRYVSEFLGEVGGQATPASAPVTATAPISSALALERDTKITYMNIGNVAASLAAGDIEAFPKAFEVVTAKYKELGVL